MTDSSIATIVLYADYTTRLSYYDDWLDAFETAHRLDVRSFNICQKNIVESLKRVLPETDLVILLHSTNGDTTNYLEHIASVLKDRKGLLVSFVGNEVNLPGSPISAKRRVLSKISPDFIATQLPLAAGEFLWGDLVNNSVLAIPHALNPAMFRPERKSAERPIDIGVRAARYVAHLGDDERNRLFDFFASHAFAQDLKIDISTERLARDDWVAFLNRCKGTVSSEAGSWYLERDDATVEAIRAWTASHGKGPGITIANDSKLRELGHKLPWGMRVFARRLLSRGLVRHESSVNEELNFAEVYDRFFRDRQKPDFYAKCISSRHFDAIGTKTCQILIHGRYNDILEAGRHYISLEPDFSNIDTVSGLFQDPIHREQIATEAYEHVLDHHTYAHRIGELEKAIAR